MLRIVPLGGLGEIGLNALVVETSTDAVLVDCGLMFPRAHEPGVDVVLPDLQALDDLAGKLRGVVLTHGHEDHVGALAHLLREHELPIYGAPLTLAVVRHRLQESGVAADLRVMEGGRLLRLGEELEVEPFHVTHSIPDAFGLALRTPDGLVVHTGDFKIDHTPVEGPTTDLQRLAAFGKEGVRLLLSDSTNAERPGRSLSERAVASALEPVFADAKARIFFSTFSSNLQRLQLVVDATRRHGRKLLIAGRAMENFVRMGAELGRIELPHGLVVDAATARSLRHDALTVLCTGAQGEPRGMLSRLAEGDDGTPVTADEGDLVVLSARVIPGSEIAVAALVSAFARRGVRVLQDDPAGLHATGHACRDEQQLMLRLTQPRGFVPIHGEARMLAAHVRIAQQTGLAERDCHLLFDGDVLDVQKTRAQIVGRVPAGKLFAESRTGPLVPPSVLEERRRLGEAGVVAVTVLRHGSTRKLARPPVLSAKGVPLTSGTHEAVAREVTAALAQLPEGLSRDDAAVRAEIELATRRAVRRGAEQRPFIFVTVLDLDS